MSVLFDFLGAVNRGDFDFIDRLSDQDMKELQPFVLLGWLHGAEFGRDAHVILTDAYVNDLVFKLHRHPKLVLMVMMAANAGLGNTKYKYVKSTSSKETKQVVAVAEYYKVSTKEAKEYIKILPEADVKTICSIMEAV